MWNFSSFSTAVGALSLLIFLQVPADLASTDPDVMYPVNSLINPGQLYPLNGPLPSPRLFPSMTIVGTSLIIYGGYRTDGALLNDIHIFDIPTGKWSGEIHRKECCNVIGATVETLGATSTLNFPFVHVGFEGDIPLARAEHGACSIAGNMYLFGGVSDIHGYLQDFYRFDPVNLKWTVLDYTSGSSPTRRAGHIMVSDGTTAIIFGGRSKDITTNNSTFSLRGLNDVWRFETKGRSWTQLISVSEGPSGRHHAAGTVMNGVLYIFGGIHPVTNVTYSDLWAFHLSSRRWQELRTGSGYDSLPPLRDAHLLPFPAMSSQKAQKIDNVLVLYGGVGSGGSCGSGILMNGSSVFPSTFSRHSVFRSSVCDQLITELGQYYKITVNSDLFNSPLLYSSFNGRSNGVEQVDLTGITWNVSIISGTRSRIDGTLEGIHLVKEYAFESVVYDSERHILYEFGGLESVPRSAEDEFDVAYNAAKEKQQENSLEYGDTENYELPRDGSISITSQNTVREKLQLEVEEIPIQPVWDFTEAYFNIQPYSSNSNIKFISKFRSFILTTEEMMLATATSDA